MAIRYDDKGKFFTDKVTKEQVAVIIQSTFGRIDGFIYVMAGARLKDEINNADQFIAVTNAKIYDSQNAYLCSCKFVSVNRDHIIWLLPQSELVDTADALGGED